MSQKFKENVDEVTDWIEEILDGSFLTNHVPRAFEAIANAKTVAHAKAMLPLCDLISTKWCPARLSSNAAAENPSIVAPISDTAVFLALSALPFLSTKFSKDSLLDPGNWEPGERARLLGPLATVLDFATNPNGLTSLRADPASRPAFNLLIDDSVYFGFALIIQTTHAAVAQAREIEKAFDKAGGPDAELAALLADVGPAKSDLATWEAIRVLGSVPLKEEDDVRMCVCAFLNMFTCLRMIQSPPSESTINTLLFDGGDIIRHEVTQYAIRRSLELGKMVNRMAAAVAANPAELKKLAGDDILLPTATELVENAAANMFSKGLIAARAVVGNSEVQAAYVGISRVAREMALAESTSKKSSALLWLFSAMLSLPHPPKSWAGETREVVPPSTIMEALRDMTEAYTVVMSREKALRKAERDVFSMMVLVAVYYLATNDFVFFGQTTEGFLPYDAKHTYYLRYARSDAAAHATVLQAVRACLVCATQLSQPDYLQAVLAPIFFPRGPLALASEVSVEHAAVAVDAAIDLMKFAMGPTRAKLKPKHGVSVGAMFAWVCTAAFSDACVMVRVACAAPSTNAAEGEAKRNLERFLAAATFKYLHFIGNEREGMEGVFICEELAAAEPAPDSKQAVESWEEAINQTIHVIAARLADQDKTLAPALAGADAEGLKVFCEIADGVGVAGEAAERVKALAAAAAAGVDPQNEAKAAKVRARILAALDCAYLGCSEVQLQGGGGKKCSGCRCVRYASASCQKEDWKTHRVACRAIQAEGGV